jgi:hypothetical protein
MPEKEQTQKKRESTRFFICSFTVAKAKVAILHLSNHLRQNLYLSFSARRMVEP